MTSEFVGVKFGNGVVVVNTTPHPLTIQDVDGKLVQVPTCGIVINASAKENPVDELLIETKFVGDAEGRKAISDIRKWFSENYGDDNVRLVIVGSIIAAQAYPEQVCGVVPVPGYERVAPPEKRKRCDRFTVFTK